MSSKSGTGSRSVSEGCQWNHGGKNLWHRLKKLVPETGTSRLVPETCTCVGQSGTSFSGTNCLHSIEHSFIPAQKLSGTWHEPCNAIGWKAESCFGVTVTNWRQNFSCKFLVQVSWALVRSKRPREWQMLRANMKIYNWAQVILQSLSLSVKQSLT